MIKCLTKKETESMTKEQKKTNKKYIAKELKKHMQKRYVDILRYLFSDTIDADKNVKILIKNEPHFYKTIEQIKQSRDFQRKENEFRETVNMEIPDVERYISDAKYQTILVGEALERTMQLQALTPKSIKYKNGRIAHLQERLKNLEITQDFLTELRTQMITEKRPVGRPKKKQKEEEELYYDEEE